jgi:general secretion pathway protein F
MPEFLWQAADSAGAITQGRMQAESATKAILALQADGLIPIQVNPATESASAADSAAAKSTPAPSLPWAWGGPKVGRVEILAMTSELSIMLKAGLPLDNALRVLIGMSANPAMVQLTQSLLDDVKGGATLSRALGKHPAHFGDFYVNMVRSGEASGQLSAVLERLTDHLERIRALRDSVISAAIYPAILLGVAVISVVSMLGFVVPQFEKLFLGLGEALPLPTRIIMNLGNAFKYHGLWILLAVVLVGVYLYRWLGSEQGRAWWQSLQLRLPVVGGILRKYNLTLYARSLGTLVGNGVPLVQALQIATLTVSNTHLRQSLATIIPKVKSGGRMADAFEASSMFEPLALSLVRVGEETGRLSPMLLELARLSDRDVESGIKRGLTLLEPVLILVLGGIIAAIIVSILLGILSINDLAV